MQIHERNGFKIFAYTLNKNANTRTDRKNESKMTMIRIRNNDNGLQDWKKEHQVLIE